MLQSFIWNEEIFLYFFYFHMHAKESQKLFFPIQKKHTGFIAAEEDRKSRIRIRKL